MPCEAGLERLGRGLEQRVDVDRAERRVAEPRREPELVDRPHAELPAQQEILGEGVQGGRELGVTLSVRPTPNPNFLRVEARVDDNATPLLSLSTVVGRY